MILSFRGLESESSRTTLSQSQVSNECSRPGLGRSEAAQAGIINQAFPADELEAKVLGIASAMAATPSAVLAVNKRAVHTAIEARGGRSVIRTLGDLQAGPHLQQLGGDAILEQVKSGNKA